MCCFRGPGLPGLVAKESGEAGVTVLSTLGLPNPTPSLEKLGWRAPKPIYHSLFLDRKCVMEWEEPHDSTFYCLQTDGNHLLATGSSYYGLVRLWDRRQRACLHVSVPPVCASLWAASESRQQGVPKAVCKRTSLLHWSEHLSWGTPSPT